MNLGQGWPTGDLLVPVKKDHLLHFASQKQFKRGRAEFMSVRKNSVQKSLDPRGNTLIELYRHSPCMY
jgi:hypothetical protein